MNEVIIKECIKLEKEYGHLPFDKALPFLQQGWWEIGEKNGKTGVEVFTIYMDWKSKQNTK